MTTTSARLSLVSHSSTSATVSAAFAADEPLDDRGEAWATSARGLLRNVHQVHCGPASACRRTASALGLDPEIDQGLRDWDLGRWRGRPLDDVAATEPDAAHTWLTEPSQAPHGGEPLTALVGRVGAWLTGLTTGGHTVAVTHPAVVRSAILTVLGAPAEGFWRIDIAPLSVTVLRGGPGRWTLRSSGVPLRR